MLCTRVLSIYSKLLQGSVRTFILHTSLESEKLMLFHCFFFLFFWQSLKAICTWVMLLLKLITNETGFFYSRSKPFLHELFHYLKWSWMETGYFTVSWGGGATWGMLKFRKDTFFLKILSQNVRHNPDLVGGLVEKLSTVYGMWGIILVSFSDGYSLPLQQLRMPNCKCPHMCIYMQVIW